MVYDRSKAFRLYGPDGTTMVSYLFPASASMEVSCHGGVVSLSMTFGARDFRQYQGMVRGRIVRVFVDGTQWGAFVVDKRSSQNTGDIRVQCSSLMLYRLRGIMPVDEIGLQNEDKDTGDNVRECLGYLHNTYSSYTHSIGTVDNYPVLLLNYTGNNSFIDAWATLSQIGKAHYGDTGNDTLYTGKPSASVVLECKPSLVRDLTDEEPLEGSCCNYLHIIGGRNAETASQHAYWYWLPASAKEFGRLFRRTIVDPAITTRFDAWTIATNVFKRHGEAPPRFRYTLHDVDALMLPWDGMVVVRDRSGRQAGPEQEINTITYSFDDIITAVYDIRPPEYVHNAGSELAERLAAHSVMPVAPAGQLPDDPFSGGDADIDEDIPEDYRPDWAYPAPGGDNYNPSELFPPGSPPFPDYGDSPFDDLEDAPLARLTLGTEVYTIDGETKLGVLGDVFVGLFDEEKIGLLELSKLSTSEGVGVSISTLIKVVTYLEQSRLSVMADHLITKDEDTQPTEHTDIEGKYYDKHTTLLGWDD